MAGAALSQGQVQISWQAQHYRKAGYRFRGRHNTFARSSTVCGGRSTFARLGTRDTFARSSTDFVAGAVFRDRRYDSTLQLQNRQELSAKVVFEVHFSSCSSKIAKNFRKAGYRFCGRRDTFASSSTRFRGSRSTFAKSGTDCVAGAAPSQSRVQK